MTDLINHSLSENILVDLDLNKKKRLALVQEVQHHPLSGKVLHVDFHEVAENEMVTIMVPVETTGEPVGVKTGGGVLEHIIFKLKVRAARTPAAMLCHIRSSPSTSTKPDRAST